MGDRRTMAEPGSIEGKTDKFPLARTTFLQTLEADGVTEAHDVHAHIARKQHLSRPPQQRDLSRAMSGTMNNLDAAGDGQCFPGDQSLVDGHRLQALIGMIEQLAQHSPQQPGRRRQRPKRTPRFGNRNVERVHVGPRTGLPHDRSSAPDMIRVAVSENQMFELVWRTAKLADRPEHSCLPIWVTSVDQCQLVLALNQVGVCHSHRNDVDTFDHPLHGHTQNPHFPNYKLTVLETRHLLMCNVPPGLWAPELAAPWLAERFS